MKDVEEEEKKCYTSCENGVGCDVSNDHMKRAKCLLFPST
jgi:hypothetical protein